MWGRRQRRRCVRLWVGALMLSSLVGCATQRAIPGVAATPTTAVPASERDATGAYRFNMTQHGRRMSADEFDAWMKARGIRVAKGAPGNAGKPAAAAPKVAQGGKANRRGANATAAAGAKAGAKQTPAGVQPAPGKAARPLAANAAKKSGVGKPKPIAPAKPVETVSLEGGQPKAKPARRGEG